MELHQGFVCADEIFSILGSRGYYLSCATSKFTLWSLPQSDEPILQSSQFLENCTQHVCLCIEWVHVRAPHFHEDKRLRSPWNATYQSYWRLDWVSGKVSVHKTWEMSSVFIGLLSKVIMTMRTWAVWYKNRTLTYVLPIFFIFVWGGSMATVGIFLRTVRCQHSFFFFKFDPWLHYLSHYFFH